MFKKILKVIYVKPSRHHGTGAIPVGAEGEVLKYVEHFITPKLLVDFGAYGLAVVPKSSVEIDCDTI